MRFIDSVNGIVRYAHMSLLSHPSFTCVPSFGGSLPTLAFRTWQSSIRRNAISCPPSLRMDTYCRGPRNKPLDYPHNEPRLLSRAITPRNVHCEGAAREWRLPLPMQVSKLSPQQQDSLQIDHHSC